MGEEGEKEDMKGTMSKYTAEERTDHISLACAYVALFMLAATRPVSCGVVRWLHPRPHSLDLFFKSRVEDAAGHILWLRGGCADEGDDEDSAMKREAAMLAEMGFECVKDGEELEKFDAEGRKITPPVSTIPGVLCSDDDLSHASELDYSSLPPAEFGDPPKDYPLHRPRAPSMPSGQEDNSHHNPEYAGDHPCPQGMLGTAPLLSDVRVKYYDLACGATHNISRAFPEQPPVSGLWQLALRVHAREYTFCAHRGVIIYDPRRSPFGQSMCVRRVGATVLRDEEVVRSLRTLHHRFNPATYDPYKAHTQKKSFGTKACQSTGPIHT